MLSIARTAEHRGVVSCSIDVLADVECVCGQSKFFFPKFVAILSEFFVM